MTLVGLGFEGIRLWHRGLPAVTFIEEELKGSTAREIIDKISMFKFDVKSEITRIRIRDTIMHGNYNVYVFSKRGEYEVNPDDSNFIRGYISCNDSLNLFLKLKVEEPVCSG